MSGMLGVPVLRGGVMVDLPVGVVFISFWSLCLGLFFIIFFFLIVGFLLVMLWLMYHVDVLIQWFTYPLK